MCIRDRLPSDYALSHWLRPRDEECLYLEYVAIDTCSTIRRVQSRQYLASSHVLVCNEIPVFVPSHELAQLEMLHIRHKLYGYRDYPLPRERRKIQDKE